MRRISVKQSAPRLRYCSGKETSSVSDMGEGVSRSLRAKSVFIYVEFFFWPHSLFLDGKHFYVRGSGQRRAVVVFF